MINCIINGRERHLDVDPTMRLREMLVADGHYCVRDSDDAEGFCGSDTVLVDGVPVFSNLMLAGEVEGCEIMTPDALGDCRHLSIVQQAMIDAGVVGDVYYMYSTRIKFGVVRTEENVFESFAPHDIATLNYFAGVPAEKMILHRGYFLQKDICDYVLAYLEYPNNLKAHIQVSWLHPFKEQRVVVVGSKGMIWFDDAGDKQVRISKKRVDFSSVQKSGDLPQLIDAEAEIVPVDYADMPLTRELKYFVAHLDTPPEFSTGADGYALVKALAESRE